MGKQSLGRQDLWCEVPDSFPSQALVSEILERLGVVGVHGIPVLC